MQPQSQTSPSETSGAQTEWRIRQGQREWRIRPSLWSYPSAERRLEGRMFLGETPHSRLQGGGWLSSGAMNVLQQKLGGSARPSFIWRKGLELGAICMEKTSLLTARVTLWRPSQSLISMNSHGWPSGTHLGQDRCCPLGYTWSLWWTSELNQVPGCHLYSQTNPVLAWGLQSPTSIASWSLSLRAQLPSSFLIL